MEISKRKIFLKNFVLFLCIFSIFFSLIIVNRVGHQKDKAIDTVSSLIAHVDVILKGYASKTKTFEFFLNALGEENMEKIASSNTNTLFVDEFKQLALSLMNNPALRSVQLAPNGIIQYVYPYKENISAIGHNLLSPLNKKEGAFEVVENKTLGISAPFMLVQGGYAMVIRNPIYYSNGKFWGLVCLVVEIPDVFLPFGLDNLTNNGYEYDLKIYKDNVTRTIGSTLTHDLKDTISKKYTIYGDEWQLSIIPKNGWLPYYYILFGAIASLLLAYIFAILMTKNTVKSLMLVDSLKKEKEMRCTVIHARDVAEQANKAKSNFLSSMSHDIRTPMNAIMGLCTLLKKDSDNPEKVTKYTAKIDNSSKHLLGLINDILDMSKIESGKASINLCEVNIASLIDEINTIVRPQANNKNQHLIFNNVKVIHEHILADKVRLNQILLNLLSNSIKYTNEGGTIELTVAEIQSNNKNICQYQFIVKDNGIGMSESYLKTIFDPFSREDERIDNIQGTGLGMSITNNLIKLMGGTIDIKSKVNVGTTTTVTLSFKATENEDEDIKFIKEHGINRILLIDDEIDTCEAVKLVLNKDGLSLDYATDGDTGVAMLEQSVKYNKPYDLVLLDWYLPIKGGYEIAKDIRKSSLKDIPIILLTSYDYYEIEDQAIEINAIDFLMKPFFLSNLKQIIENDLCKNSSTVAKKTENPLEGLNILAAEDNALNAEILVDILEMKGAKCHVCPNGKEVVNHFKNSKQNEYDLILMDIQMPEMNGLEASRAIRALPDGFGKNIPIIAMTANAFTDDIKASIDAGLNEHLSKPINITELEKTVANLLSK